MALDTFIGTAGNLTDPWSKDAGASSMQRDGSGNARAGASADAEYMVYAGATGLAQEARVVAAAGISGIHYIGPMVRYGSGKGFLASSSPGDNTIYVTRHTSGAAGPDIATRTHPSGGLAAGNDLKLVINDQATNPTLQLYLGGVKQGSDIIWTGTDSDVGTYGMTVYRNTGTQSAIAEWEDRKSVV